MAPQVRIEPPPSRLLLSQYAIFEVLLIFMTMRMTDNFHVGSLDERAGQNVSIVITRCVRKVIGQGRHFVTFQSSCLMFQNSIDQTLI